MTDTKMYVALTSDCGKDALEMVEPLRGLPVGVKIGLELFMREGPGSVEPFRRLGFSVFLDLKFHDIPYTVAGAVRAVCDLEPDLINVHASGGRAMMEAAAEACHSGTRIIAVTVLTSMDAADLALLGSSREPLTTVVELASAARTAGLHGVVCSPLEAFAVRRSTSKDFLVVTPGIRPAGADRGDQKRFMTPFKAIKAGADALVVGRPVTGAPDPAAAAAGILEDIEKALA